MKTSRQKITAPLITTRAQADRLLGELASLTIQRRQIENDLDAEIAAARERATPQLAALIAPAAEKSELLRLWAEANPEEFGKKKSLSLLHGVIGFRTGTPKLKPLSRRTWDTVLGYLKSVPWGAAYIRITEEVDKARALADLAQGNLSEDEASAAGFRRVQDESFFIEPRLENLEEAA